MHSFGDYEIIPHPGDYAKSTDGIFLVSRNLTRSNQIELYSHRPGEKFVRSADSCDIVPNHPQCNLCKHWDGDRRTQSTGICTKHSQRSIVTLLDSCLDYDAMHPDLPQDFPHLPPPFKYPGAKRKQSALLWEQVGYPYRDRKMVFLFAGAATEAFWWQPKRAVLNDINPVIINVLRQIQQGGLKINIPMLNQKDYYLGVRNLFNIGLTLKDKSLGLQAEEFLYLTQFGFNGLVRFGPNGFNVPFGQYSDNRQVRTDYSQWAAPMQNWDLMNEDFRLIETRDNDLVVFDPPYFDNQSPQLSLFSGTEAEEFGEKNESFTGYAGNKFTWQDQLDLANKMAEHLGPAIGYNLYSRPIVELYLNRGFSIAEIMIRHSIAAKAKSRGDRRELIIYRNLELDLDKLGLTPVVELEQAQA